MNIFIFLFIFYLYKSFQGSDAENKDEIILENNFFSKVSFRNPMLYGLPVTILSVSITILGADITVDSAISITKILNISDSFIKADDMGRASLFNKSDNNSSDFKEGVPYFFGTETGAFACLDGFSEHTKMQMEGREIGYNKHSLAALKLLFFNSDDHLSKILDHLLKFLGILLRGIKSSP